MARTTNAMASRAGGFARFYRTNIGGLRRYLSRMLPVRADADEIAQEAFTRVLAAGADETADRPEAVLYRTARNLALNHAASHRVRTSVSLDPEAVARVVDHRPTAEAELVARERLRRLSAAVDRLPPQCRQVFVMRKIEELSNIEIADRLGLSVSTVEKHIAKGLRLCRAYVDADEESLTRDGDVGASKEKQV